MLTINIIKDQVRQIHQRYSSLYKASPAWQDSPFAKFFLQLATLPMIMVREVGDKRQALICVEACFNLLVDIKLLLFKMDDQQKICCNEVSNCYKYWMWLLHKNQDNVAPVAPPDIIQKADLLEYLQKYFPSASTDTMTTLPTGFYKSMLKDSQSYISSKEFMFKTTDAISLITAKNLKVILENENSRITLISVFKRKDTFESKSWLCFLYYQLQFYKTHFAKKELSSWDWLNTLPQKISEYCEKLAPCLPERNIASETMFELLTALFHRQQLKQKASANKDVTPLAAVLGTTARQIDYLFLPRTVNFELDALIEMFEPQYDNMPYYQYLRLTVANDYYKKLVHNCEEKHRLKQSIFTDTFFSGTEDKNKQNYALWLGKFITQFDQFAADLPLADFILTYRNHQQELSQKDLGSHLPQVKQQAVQWIKQSAREAIEAFELWQFIKRNKHLFEQDTRDLHSPYDAQANGLIREFFPQSPNAWHDFPSLSKFTF